MIEPKLALIPSAYKANKVYSVLPNDGTGDFDFTRSGDATRINKEGLIETVGNNVPRINYPLIDGVVSGCPSLMLEPASTNLIQYSEDFMQGWTKSNSTVTSNQVISPDGTLNADKLVSSANTSIHYLSDLISGATIGLNYTFSIFAKASEEDVLAYRDSTYGTVSLFDLSNGSVIEGSNHNSSIIDFGNGWYKCITTSETAFSDIEIRLSPRDYTSYTGDGTSGLYIWGAQLELGNYATSYIPNYGTALGATRSAETCNGAGDANTFNGIEGVLMAEISALANDLTSRRINLRNSSGSNQIRIEFGTSSNLIVGVLFNGANQAIINNTSNNILNSNKIAFKYKQNDFALWVNGLKVGTDIVGTTIGTDILDRIDLSVSPNQTYSNIKQIQYFDNALNDADLEILTSWRSFNEMANALQYTII
jgi:hypothetical protein